MLLKKKKKERTERTRWEKTTAVFALLPHLRVPPHQPRLYARMRKTTAPVHLWGLKQQKPMLRSLPKTHPETSALLLQQNVV